MTVFPLIPLWLIGVLLLAAAGVAGYVWRRRPVFLSPLRHRLLLAVRLLAWLALFAALLNPGRLKEERNVERSQVVFLMDRSASMATRDMPYQTTRWEAAVRFLADHPFKRLAAYPRPLFAFNTQCAALSNRTAVAALAPEGGTDLRRAVETVDRTVGMNRVSALVLLSDGLDTSGFSGSEAPVPLFCVQTGSDLSGARDVAVRPFDLPGKVSVNETVTVDIPLLLNGYPNARAVTFEAKVDGTVCHTATLELTKGRPHAERVSFTVTEPGIHLFECSCGALEGEVSLLNNRQFAAIEAVETQTAVFAYFPVLNASFRPLLREFTKADAPPFTALCRMSDHLYTLKGRDPDLRFKDGLPEKAETLKGFSVVVLGGHSRDLLSDSEAYLLERYVRAGGSLICLAGSESYGRLTPRSPMERMLPVVPADEPTVRAGRYAVRVGETARGGFAERMRALIAEQEGDAAFVLTSLNTVKGVKAQAEVLLTAEAEERLPLVVAQLYGRGKVIALLSNAIHQWGKAERRDAVFSAFWRQLVAYAGAGEESSEWLTLHLERDACGVGETVELRAEARRPERVPERVPLRVEARVIGMDDGKRVFHGTLTEKGNGAYAVTLPAISAAGRYRIEADLKADDEVLRSRYAFLSVGESWRERDALDATPARFRRICPERHCFTLEEADRLEDALVTAVRKNLQTSEERLVFDHPACLAAVIAVLLMEWIFRRLTNQV